MTFLNRTTTPSNEKTFFKIKKISLLSDQIVFCLNKLNHIQPTISIQFTIPKGHAYIPPLFPEEA